MTGRELIQEYEDLINLQINSTSVKCPLCRTMNDKSKVTKIKGLSVGSVCLIIMYHYIFQM